MVKALSPGLRACLRTASSRTLRCQQSLPERKCLAIAICPARSRRHATSSSSPISTRTTHLSSQVRRDITMGMGADRMYSTRDGTIAKGAEGAEDVHVVEEAEEKVPRAVLIAPDHLDDNEKKIFEMLNKELNCVDLQVQDISGGCGSMYGIDIVSEKFRGLSMLKQQRLVNQVLGDEIKGWHGVQLKTRAP